MIEDIPDKQSSRTRPIPARTKIGSGCGPGCIRGQVAGQTVWVRMGRDVLDCGDRTMPDGPLADLGGVSPEIAAWAFDDPLEDVVR